MQIPEKAVECLVGVLFDVFFSLDDDHRRVLCPLELESDSGTVFWITQDGGIESFRRGDKASVGFDEMKNGSWSNNADSCCLIEALFLEFSPYEFREELERLVLCCRVEYAERQELINEWADWAEEKG